MHVRNLVIATGWHALGCSLHFDPNTTETNDVNTNMGADSVDDLSSNSTQIPPRTNPYDVIYIDHLVSLPNIDLLIVNIQKLLADNGLIIYTGAGYENTKEDLMARMTRLGLKPIKHKTFIVANKSGNVDDLKRTIENASIDMRYFLLNQFKFPFFSKEEKEKLLEQAYDEYGNYLDQRIQNYETNLSSPQKQGLVIDKHLIRIRELYWLKAESLKIENIDQAIEYYNKAHAIAITLTYPRSRVAYAEILYCTIQCLIEAKKLDEAKRHFESLSSIIDSGNFNFFDLQKGLFCDEALDKWESGIKVYKKLAKLSAKLQLPNSHQFSKMVDLFMVYEDLTEGSDLPSKDNIEIKLKEFNLSLAEWRAFLSRCLSELKKSKFCESTTLLLKLYSFAIHAFKPNEDEFIFITKVVEKIQQQKSTLFKPTVSNEKTTAEKPIAKKEF